MTEIILMIVGAIIGIVLFCLVIALGACHAIDEAEETKNMITESDLFNYYKDK